MGRPRKIRKNSTSEEDDQTSSSETSGNEVYCHCRTTDDSGYMIACDICDIWYHGRCVQISAKVGNTIDKYYCKSCVEKDPSLKIVYKIDRAKSLDSVKSESDKKKGRPPKIKDEFVEYETEKMQSNANSEIKREQEWRCGMCIGCFRDKDCGNCPECQALQPCSKRKCVQAGVMAAKKDTPYDRDSLSRKYRKKKESESEADHKQRYKKKTHSEKTSNVNSAMSEVYNSILNRSPKKHEKVTKPVQCLGPECIYAARHDSKYCSEKCGMALAKKRLTRILPGRMAEYRLHESAMQEANKQRLSEIWKQYDQLRADGEQLKKWNDQMNVYLDMFSTAREASESELRSISDEVNENGAETIEENGNASQENEFIVSCVICSKEVLLKNATRHLHLCYLKTEKQSTFGGPDFVIGHYAEIICNKFNKTDQSYCRRLKVMCPDHYTPKETEMCAYPLVWQDEAPMKTLQQLFDELNDSVNIDNNQVCTKNQKDCEAHYGWAQRILGLVDNERMNILMKLDDLREIGSNIEGQMKTRGDVLSLLRNRTIHETLPRHMISDPAIQEDMEIENGTSTINVDAQTPLEIREVTGSVAEVNLNG